MHRMLRLVINDERVQISPSPRHFYKELLYNRVMNLVYLPFILLCTKYGGRYVIHIDTL